MGTAIDLHQSRGIDGIISDPEVLALVKELRESKVKQDVKAAGAAASNKGSAGRRRQKPGDKKAGSGDKKPDKKAE